MMMPGFLLQGKAPDSKAPEKQRFRRQRKNRRMARNRPAGRLTPGEGGLTPAKGR